MTAPSRSARITSYNVCYTKLLRIYAQAYDQSPEARDLYEFLKSMEMYKTVLGPDTTLILSSDSELFRFLDRAADAENE